MYPFFIFLPMTDGDTRPPTRSEWLMLIAAFLWFVAVLEWTYILTE